MTTDGPGPDPAHDDLAALRVIVREHIACCLEDPPGRDADTEADDLMDALAPYVAAQAPQARYESCVIDGEGRCTRWAHDHDAAIPAQVAAEPDPDDCARHKHGPAYGRTETCSRCGRFRFPAQVSDTDAERSWHEVALVATAGESRAEHERDEARAQVAERDAEIAWWKGACAEAEVRYIDAEADRDAALARVDAARRDALTGANRAAVEMLADLAGLMNDHRDAAILCEAAANLSEVKP